MQQILPVKAYYQKSRKGLYTSLLYFKWNFVVTKPLFTNDAYKNICLSLIFFPVV